jgi:tight adherence protein B
MNQTLVILLIAGLAAVIVIAIGFAFVGGATSQEKVVKRAQVLAGTGARNARRVRAQPLNSPEARRKQILKGLQEQERRAQKRRLNLANRLKQAGLTMTVPQFWIAGGVLGLVVFGITFFMHVNLLVGFALGAASGVGLPQWILGFLAQRRTNKFTGAFSDAMDIIVRGIKSGLPVHDCLKIIGRETQEPLAGEFRRLVENIGLGMSLDQALERLHEHMPTNEVRFFSIVMNIQQKSGGNLAEALNNLSQVLRARKLMKEKVKALSAEATSSAMIIGCLPPGVIILITLWTPSYMQPMFTDHRGWLMLGGSAIWMGMGIFVMTRMINFKF